jgi:hypothetical protein
MQKLFLLRKMFDNCKHRLLICEHLKCGAICLNEASRQIHPEGHHGHGNAGQCKARSKAAVKVGDRASGLLVDGMIVETHLPHFREDTASAIRCLPGRMQHVSIRTGFGRIREIQVVRTYHIVWSVHSFPVKRWLRLPPENSHPGRWPTLFVSSPFENPLDVKGGKWTDGSRVDSEN